MRLLYSDDSADMSLISQWCGIPQKCLSSCFIISVV